jgi:hypothetical protein
VAIIRATSKFQKQASRLIKKYTSLSEELKNLETLLAEKPDYGVPLGKDCFKIRLAVKSKGKGKRGGMRVITHVLISLERGENSSNDTVYLLALYDKSEQEAVSDQDLQSFLRDIRA